MCIEVPWFCSCRFPCTFDDTWLAALKASASVKHAVLDIVGPQSFTGWAQLCLLLSLAVMSFLFLVVFAVRGDGLSTILDIFDVGSAVAACIFGH